MQNQPEENQELHFEGPQGGQQSRPEGHMPRDDYEIIDGYGHVRPAQRLRRAAGPSRNGDGLSLERPNIYTHPGSQIACDARTHHEAPFGTLNLWQVHQPWIPVQQVLQENPIPERGGNTQGSSERDFGGAAAGPELHTGEAPGGVGGTTHTPPSTGQVDRQGGMWLSANQEILDSITEPGSAADMEQLQARALELTRLIELEKDRHVGLLGAIVAADPYWGQQSPEAQERQQEELWLRQTRTFEECFLAEHGIGFTMAGAMGGSVSALFRQRQLIEARIMAANGLDPSTVLPATEYRLRFAALEAQLLTLQAWTEAWEGNTGRHRQEP